MIELNEVVKVYRRGSREVRALDGKAARRERRVRRDRGPKRQRQDNASLHDRGTGETHLGLVVVDGVDLGALSSGGLAELRRKKFGFVFQMFHLIPYLTSAENVAISPVGREARRGA